LNPPDGERALSFDGYNHYRAALISFGNWLVKVRRCLPANPFSGISRRNPHENPVHPRRTLTAEEFSRFLAAVRDGPERFGLSGSDREMLYLVAACSGLRAAALAGLTAKQFDLASVPPILHATASLQKNRKAHAIPLPMFLVERLRVWLAGRDGLLWPGNWSRWNSSAMVYRDLKASEIEPETSEGWFDFHALRHQYATMLVDSGATPAEVQQLLDHSTPALTARYFRHLTTDRLAVPVERLPRMG
jgi:integrase